jgi:heme/copper-type cytochrome/quinol oxidase subunit 2
MEVTNNPNQPPDNYLVWAILSTVCCCLPLGIVSIIKSSNVNTLWAQGLYEQAHKSAADAKKFAIISAVVSVVGIFLYIMLVLFFVVIGQWNNF